MMRLIRAFFSRGASPQRGYVYVERDDPGIMAAAAPGVRVQIAGRGPPWIVVDHDLATVIVAHWPGCLWHVEVIDSIAQQDGADALRADAGYTRAAAVMVLKQVPAADMFGPHGSKVCTVIDAAGELTRETAGRLAEQRHARAGEAQTRLWRAWITRQQPPIAGLAPGYDGSFDGVLGIGSRSRSPVGVALRVISAQVGRRAVAVDGEGVWSEDPDDPEGAMLAAPWQRAQFPLFDAALAVGVRELVSDADRSILLEGWRSVLGADPA